jgi:translation initiation factor 2B subunit (eIF-2B alpha/beta/delta family)
MDMLGSVDQAENIGSLEKAEPMEQMEPRETTDAALLAVITPVVTDTNSPLHEMLREFIAKLESLESETGSLDTQMAIAQAEIQAQRISLEDEYHARLAVIQSAQSHIMDGKTARQEEKRKLRNIIENLEKEIA